MDRQDGPAVAQVAAAAGREPRTAAPLSHAGPAVPREMTQRQSARNSTPSAGTCANLHGRVPVRKRLWLCGLLTFLLVICGAWRPREARAAGGPLGIDHRLRYNDHGIWSRSNQLLMLDLLMLGDAAGAVWEGGQTRLGKTYWQSLDSLVLGGISSTALKMTFTRERPGQVNDPNRFFTGHGNQSFPSGEVTATTAIVTPFVLEYGDDHPWVWSLEILPLYDAQARMNTWGHWQTDVLGGFLLGTAVGYYAHKRHLPFTLSVMPHSIQVGLRTKF